MTPSQTLHHRVRPEEAGSRLDRTLADAFPAISRSRLKALIEAGQVRLADGTAVRDPAARVQVGQNFVTFVPEALPATPRAEAIPLTVRYEDEDVIVIDKAAGMVVHPGAGNPAGTLVNALIAHCGDSLSGIGGERRPGIVHRIDKDTSGLLVVAKNDLAHAGLARQFAAHTLERGYTAVAWGAPVPPFGRVDARIGRGSRDRTRMAVVAAPRGREAVTHYRTMRRLSGGLATVLQLRLETGRTHQIRVHMAHIGHPLVGDPAYGRRTAARRAALEATLGGAPADRVGSFGRQALHAFVIGFIHPRTGETIRVESSLPNDIKELIEILESGDGQEPNPQSQC